MQGMRLSSLFFSTLSLLFLPFSLVPLFPGKWVDKDRNQENKQNPIATNANFNPMPFVFAPLSFLTLSRKEISHSEPWKGYVFFTGSLYLLDVSVVYSPIGLCEEGWN